ncbi:MAG TPA: histidine kinase [Gemmatimonas sp.]|nr:histidine kinase [Gemmatimonas sp.]
MPSASVATLVHAAGFLTGIALYAMLGWMLLRRERLAVGAPDTRLPLTSAILGVVWNAGGLLYYGAPSLGLLPASPVVGAIAFSALGFLPAAVVRGAVRDDDPISHRALLWAAYGVSITSMVLQWLAVGRGRAPDSASLLLLTVGYGTILIGLALRHWRTPHRRGTFATAGLAVFAVMSLHLSQHREGADSVIIELLGHQGSLPLAVVLLYQDFRVAFADLFLKRALALLAVVALAIVLFVRIAPEASAAHGGIIVLIAVALAVVYPTLQRGSARFVDRVVLRRTNFAEVRQDLSGATQACRSEASVVDLLRATLQRAFGGGHVAIVSTSEDLAFAADAQPIDDRAVPANAGARGGQWAPAARVVVRCLEAPWYVVTIGELRDGRRFLSDDLLLLDAAALLAARRIDELRAEQARFERAAADIEARRLVSEAELRALRAQLDPHFLFNSLTTIGHLLTEAPARARTTLLKLTDLLRAVLRPGAADRVALREELDIVTAYLGIEQARFEERLGFTIDVPASLDGIRVPPLLVQPLVENAVKHGIAPLRRGGHVFVSARLESVNDANDQASARLVLTVRDTGAGFDDARPARVGDGHTHEAVGLRNVQQRLAHLFGAEGGMAIESRLGEGTSVTLRIPVTTTGRERERERGSGDSKRQHGEYAA